MDRLIYTAMTGAKHIMEKQATTAQNLANATTPGFRAQLDTFRSAPVQGAPLATRVFAVDATVGTDFSEGPIQHTGRALDVAVQGRGWIAVQAPNGGEAYTRHGSLKVSENGILQTQSGFPVVADAGTIAIPPDTIISIGVDGTVSSVTNGQSNEVAILGRIKLVNPPEQDLVRGGDGNFRLRNGGEAEGDAAVSLIGSALEGSNVSVVDAMVEMISHARQFELHMNVLKNAESNSTKASQLLSLTS